MKTLALPVLLVALPAFSIEPQPYLYTRDTPGRGESLTIDQLSDNLLVTARNISTLVNYLHPEKFAEFRDQAKPLSPEARKRARDTLDAEVAAVRPLIADGNRRLEAGIPRGPARATGISFTPRPLDSFKVVTSDDQKDRVALMRCNVAGTMGVLIARRRHAPSQWDKDGALRNLAKDAEAMAERQLKQARATLEGAEKLSTAESR